MKIRILGWEYINIRRINNLCIDLTNGTTLSKISLIMMPNGTGKTTTISLMRAVLDGTATSWPPDKVREFKPQYGDIKKGEFRLKTKINEELFYFILCLDYENGKAEYKTSRTGQPGGLDDGRNLPYQLSGVFNEQFVSRFVFDGEQAKKTLSNDNDEAEKAITYLYQINELDNLKEKVNAILKQAQDNNTRGMTKQSLSYNKTQMENKERNFKNLLRKKGQLEKARTELIKQREETQNKIDKLISSDSKLKDEKTKLDADKIETVGYIRQNIAAILAGMREPFNVNACFDQRLKDLSDNMQKLKLPKTMSKEFFNELAESSTCICGRHIGPEEKKHIEENAESYLGEDQLVALNAIKDKIKGYVAIDDLILGIDRLNTNVKKLDDIEAGLIRLGIQLKEQGNDEVEKLQNDLKTIDSKLQDTKNEYGILTAIDRASNGQINDENNIKLAEAAFTLAKENFNKATDTFSLYQKSEKVKQYLDIIRASALEKLKLRVLDKTNRKISNIITTEKIIIEKIDGNLVLKNRKAASEGQSLAIAYSYIGSLFDESSFRFPFVIDSPAVSLDLSVRKEVAEILPNLFEQLVIFVISSEVSSFADSFYTLPDVAFYTIEARDSSDNAICTVGKDYFDTFQKD